jgi:hypothetical protein
MEGNGAVMISSVNEKHHDPHWKSVQSGCDWKILRTAIGARLMESLALASSFEAQI